jgi:hypothetical protein
MNITQDDKALLRTGSSRVAYTDDWSLTVEATGLAPNGDPITFRVAFSRGELAMIERAAKRTAPKPAPQPTRRQLQRRQAQARMPDGERDQLDYPHNVPGAPFQSGDY